MTFYNKLTPLEQFELVCMITSMCVFFAVILRELFNDREIQIAARLLGLAGFALLGAFAFRMASQLQQFEQRFAVQAKDVSVSQIGFAIRTKDGHDFVPGAYTDGVRATADGLWSGVGSDRYRNGGFTSLRRGDGNGTAAIGLGIERSSSTGNHGVDPVGSVLAEQWWASGSDRASGASSGDEPSTDF